MPEIITRKVGGEWVVECSECGHKACNHVLVVFEDMGKEIMRLREYEEQCNTLSQRFCKHKIAEGVPAAIEELERTGAALKAVMAETEPLEGRTSRDPYETGKIRMARRINKLLREHLDKEGTS